MLLTNAVMTNAASWPVALHSKLDLDAGLAALSSLARAMIQKRGHVEEREVAALTSTGYDAALALEVSTVVAASTVTNYVASLAAPELEPALAPHAWP